MGFPALTFPSTKEKHQRSGRECDNNNKETSKSKQSKARARCCYYCYCGHGLFFLLLSFLSLLGIWNFAALFEV
jgi:hypothetical protein